MAQRRVKMINDGSNKMILDESSELSDESGTSGLSFKPTDSDSNTDSSTEDLELATKVSKNKVNEKNKIASNKHTKKKRRKMNYSSGSLSPDRNKQIMKEKFNKNLIQKDQEVTKNIVTTKTTLEERVKISFSKASKETNVQGNRRKKQANTKGTKSKAVNSGETSRSLKVKQPVKRLNVGANTNPESNVENSETPKQRKHDSLLNLQDNSAAVCNTVQLKRRRFDKKIVKQACELLKQGFSNRIVAEKLNVPEYSVKYWRYQHLPLEDYEMMKKKPGAQRIQRQIEDTPYHSKETITKVCEFVKQGVTVKKISCEFGIPERTIRKWRNNYIPKEELPPDSKLSEEQILEACELLKQGNTAKSVAQQFGVSAQTVIRWKYKFVPKSEVRIQTSHLFDNNKILEVCRQLDRGYAVQATSKSTGVKAKTIVHWNIKYMSERLDRTEGRWNGYIMLEACHRLQQGVAAETVAKELSVSVNLVRKWESENALILRAEPQDGRKYDKQFILDVCNRLQRGGSAKKIARELHIDSSTVYQWKEKYFQGRKPESKDGLKYKKETFEACELFKKGETLINVARKLKVDFRRVHKWRIRQWVGGGASTQGMKILSEI